LSPSYRKELVALLRGLADATDTEGAMLEMSQSNSRECSELHLVFATHGGRVDLDVTTHKKGDATKAVSTFLDSYQEANESARSFAKKQKLTALVKQADDLARQIRELSE
jgi:hypothetical protein